MSNATLPTDRYADVEIMRPNGEKVVVRYGMDGAKPWVRCLGPAVPALVEPAPPAPAPDGQLLL